MPYVALHIRLTSFTCGDHHVDVTPKVSYGDGGCGIPGNAVIICRAGIGYRRKLHGGWSGDMPRHGADIRIARIVSRSDNQGVFAVRQIRQRRRARSGHATVQRTGDGH